MVIQITENRKINGKQYLAPQQYTFVRQYFVNTSSIYSNCQNACSNAGIMVYDIMVDGVITAIPADMAAFTTKETPSTDKRGSIELWEEKRTKDITVPEGGHTDVVEQAEKYLGLDIRKRTRNVEVDQVKLRELREIKRTRHGH